MTNNPNQSPEQEPIKPTHSLFEAAIREVLQANNPEFISLMSYLIKLLRQFHLADLHSPEEVFNIAYCRGIQVTKAGTHIEIPMAWMRRTCLNIIRELSRADRKVDSLDQEGTPQPIYEDSFLSDEIHEEEIEILYTALSQLNEVDRELLELRYLHGFSWQEIGQCLSITTKGKQTLAMLRQRGHRALNRLRRIYAQVRIEKGTDLY